LEAQLGRRRPLLAPIAHFHGPNAAAPVSGENKECCQCQCRCRYIGQIASLAQLLELSASGTRLPEHVLGGSGPGGSCLLAVGDCARLEWASG